MRNAFAKSVTQLAQRDPRVVLLMGDIGNRLFDDFKAKFPGRFYNCGIAEANMVSMAAGLAMSGLRPVCYTIAPFITARPLEQIRVDLCYHHQPVVLVGVGSGLCYAELGGTHQSCDDIALMRALPGMSVIAPADNAELDGAMHAALRHDGPVYVRLGKKGEQAVHPHAIDFKIGRAIPLRDGGDACLIVTGIIAPVALEAAALLEQRGIGTRVVSMPTVKPIDRAMLAGCFARPQVVATVEEHGIVGGLGSAVAEWLTEHGGAHAPLIRIGTPDEYLHEAGDQDHARERLGLTAIAIADRVSAALARPLSSAA